MNKLKSLLPYAVLPLMLGLFLLLMANTTSMPTREVHGQNGVWDLRGFDFENYNALLVGDVAFIPYALLAPEEFAARSNDVRVGNTANITFLTSQVVILVSDDEWYTFARDSILHSHRQYANGEWLSFAARGRPGYSRESEIAGEGKIVFTVRPQNGVIELVQQSSSFVHSRNDHHMGWLVGEGAGLIDHSRALDFQRGIEMGFFLLLFLLFLLLYFVVQQNRAALYFSLFCLMWLLRIGTTGVWAFSVLLPWLSWAVKFRIQYIALPVAAILTFAIIAALFPKILCKTVIRILYLISAAFIVLYTLTDTVFMSQVLLVLDAETLIHSDQGCHYTSKKFRQIVSDLRLRQSMSRRGNCWDNAPQESFFGHMKEEVAAAMTQVTSFEEAQSLIDDWMDYYNNDRPQWLLAKLSPNEYYADTNTDSRR